MILARWRGISWRRLALLTGAVLLGSVLAGGQTPLPGLREPWRWQWFGPESGLPAASIDKIMESPSGELWVLTRAGMAWFNGTYWQSLSVSTQPPDLRGATLVADTAALYLVTLTNLYRVDHAGYHLIELLYGSTRVVPRRIVPFTGRGLLIQGDSSLYLLSNGSLTRFPSPFDLADPRRIPETTHGIYVSRSGFPLLNAPGGLYRWRGDRWTVLFPLVRDYLTFLNVCEDTSGRGMLCGRIGSDLYRVDWTSDGSVSKTPLMPSEAVQMVDCTPQGDVLVLDQSGGVQARAGMAWHTFESGPAELVGATSIRFDGHGNLWVGKVNGISVCNLSSELWQRFTSPRPGPVNTVNVLLHAADSALWVGTSDGILVYRGSKLVREIQSIAQKKLGIITGLAQDAGGNIWVSSGASFGGAYRWDGNAWKHFGKPEGFSDNGVHRIVRDRQGRLWFLTISFYAPGLYPELEDGAFAYDGQRFERLDRRNGLPDGRVYAIAEDSSGGRWFATAKGLGRLRDDRWTYWTIQRGLRTDRVFTLAVDRDQRVWIGHQTQGLGYIDTNDAVVYMTPEKGFVNAAVWDLLVDYAGRLWVATREGLAVFNHGAWSTLGPRDGLPNPNTWPLMLRDSVLYVGMSNAGVAMLRLSGLEGPPPVVRFNDPLDRGDLITIGWQAYAARGASFGRDVQTRYSLDGGEWSRWDFTNHLDLRGLSWGEHGVAVQSRGALAQIDPAGAIQRFRIPPPFYFRPFFLLPVGILSLMLLSLGVVSIRRKARHASELREREHDLKNSEERYRIIAEATGQLVYELDVPTGEIAWQGAIAEVTGYSPEEFLSVDRSRLAELIHPDDQARVHTAMSHGQAAHEQVQIEFRLRKKDGDYVAIYDNGIFLAGTGTDPDRKLGTMTDITARKEVEEQIAASLKEKEVLLKEIHHRVKNNLQVISSLLSLQSGAATDVRAQEQLRESQTRIRSMAFIHERLYQSENLARVNFGEYVRSLGAFLFRTYNVHGVHLRYSIQPCNLPVNTAIPCGLVITELVSNALKYAFVGRDGGEVEIGLAVLEDNRVVLTVRDDGVGFPRDLDFRSTKSLGLQLVNTLTTQINGTIGLIRDRGTTFTITMPPEDSNETA
jgi:PAS domain S-box-containing protein